MRSTSLLRAIPGGSSGYHLTFELACLFLWATLASISFAGCVYTTPDISISHPKMYLDDQALKTFAERRKSLRDISKGIQAKPLQEILDVKERTRRDFQISASPTTGGIVSAPEPVKTEDISLAGQAPRSADVGLDFRSLLRNAVVQDQFVMGYELLYLGDSQVLGGDNRVVLLRFDVSINNYLKDYLFKGDTHFAIVGFTVDAVMENGRDLAPHEIMVYTLVPEYAAINAQESLLRSKIDTFASQIGGTFQGVDVKTSLRYQHALEESFLTVLQQPLQFAIYENEANKFGFAFGPRRHLNKRLWINPQRIFGDTYEIQYEIEPGPRDLYALLIIPKLTRILKVAAVPNSSFVDNDFFQMAQWLSSVGKEINAAVFPTDKLFTSKAAGGGSVGKAEPSLNEEFIRTAVRSAFKTIETVINQMETKEKEEPVYAYPKLRSTFGVQTRKAARNLATVAILELPKASPSDLELEPTHEQSTDKNPTHKSAVHKNSTADPCFIWPEYIFPSQTSHLLITCRDPISLETEVFLDNVVLAKDQLTVLGRFRLKVTVPPHKGFEEVLDNPAIAPKAVNVRMVTPDRSLYSFTKAVELRKSKKVEELPFSVRPDKGPGGTEIWLSVRGRDMTKVNSVRVAGQAINRNSFLHQKIDSISFAIPAHPNQTFRGSVSIEVNLDDPNNPREYLPSAFTYQ